MMNVDVDKVLPKAQVLAEHCAQDGVPDNYLAMVLAHLGRHRDVAATLRLLSALPSSPFGQRTRSTFRQMTGLRRHVSAALAGSPAPSWEQAAWIVGWARRLVRSSGERR